MAVQEAAEGKSQRQIENAEKARQLEIEEGKLNNETKKVDNEPSPTASGLTPYEQQEVKQDKQSAALSARSYYGQYQEAGEAPKTPAEWHGLAALVAKETGVSLAVASKAVAKLHEETARTNALVKASPSFGP